MTQRGPKPKPTSLRLLDGGRAKKPNEPKPTIPVAAPKAPSYLKGYARAEWRRIIEDLYSTGTYTNVDESMLAAYCTAYHQWRVSMDDLARMSEADPYTHGAMIMTTNGNAIQNPLVGVVNAARRDMQRLASEFGLTPSSRTLISAMDRGGGDSVARKYGL